MESLFSKFKSFEENGRVTIVAQEEKTIATVIAKENWLDRDNVTMEKRLEFYFPAKRDSFWLRCGGDGLMGETEHCAVGDIVECEFVEYYFTYAPHKWYQAAINITKNISHEERIAKANKYYKKYLTRIESTQRTSKEK